MRTLHNIAIFFFFFFKTDRIVAIYCLQHHHNHDWNTVLRPGSNIEKKRWPAKNNLKWCVRQVMNTQMEKGSWKQLISALILPLLYSQEGIGAPHLWSSAGHSCEEKEIFLGLIQRQNARTESVQSVCESFTFHRTGLKDMGSTASRRERWSSLNLYQDT